MCPFLMCQLSDAAAAGARCRAPEEHGGVTSRKVSKKRKGPSPARGSWQSQVEETLRPRQLSRGTTFRPTGEGCRAPPSGNAAVRLSPAALGRGPAVREDAQAVVACVGHDATLPSLRPGRGPSG